ncbi:MAG: hypothetical protein AAF960_17535 [Bacteroidota bacterium]
MDSSLQMPFNEAQVEILKLFSQGLTDKQTEELRRILIAFRFKLLDEQAKKVATKKGLTMQQINAVSKEHNRVPSKNKSPK